VSTLPTDIVPIFGVLPPENINLFKFLIEAHEGLCIGRTLDPERGEVVVLALPDTVNEVNDLLAALAPEVQFRITPPPSNLDGDWLLMPE